jgi:hypothetical protein
MLHHYRENSYRKNDEGDRNIKKKLFTETIVTFVTDDRNFFMPLVTLVDMHYVYWTYDLNSRINMTILCFETFN